MNLKYLDLPKLPKDIIEDIYTTVNAKVASSLSNNAWWLSFRTSAKVTEYVRSMFDSRHDVSIFYLTGDLPIHNDIIRDTAYNYVLETGGNSITYFYNDDKEEVEKHQIEPARWVELNVKEWHSVKIPEPPRIVLTVKKPWKNRLDLENGLIEDETGCHYYDTLGLRASNDDECTMNLYREYCNFTKGNLINLGCGTGHLITKLSTTYPELSITGYDGSQLMVDTAINNTKDHSQVTIKKSLFSDITEGTDCIVSMQTLHRQYDPIGSFWLPIKKLAKKGTKVFITDFERLENLDFLNNFADTELKNCITAAFTKEEIEIQLAYIDLKLKVERQSIKGSPLSRVIVYGEFI